MFCLTYRRGCDTIFPGDDMKKILAFLLAALSAVTLTSCLTSHPTEWSFFAMDTYMSLKLYGKGNALVANAILGDAEYYDPLLCVTDENSDIYRINHAEGEPAAVYESIPPLIEEAKALCADLDGYLNIGLYPVSTAWGFTTDNYRIPSREEIGELLKNTDYRNIVTDTENNTVTLPEGMMIDLGAVAKGWLADRAKNNLKNSGDISGIVDFGGTILPWGMKNGKELWTVGIQDPENPSAYFATLSLTEKILSTSGGYERFFIGEDGKKYIHIIDPETGYPIDNGTLSVTVVCDSGVAADALSTALFVMGEEKAEKFYQNDTKYGFDYILLNENNELFISEGIAGSFALSDGYDYHITYISK